MVDARMLHDVLGKIAAIKNNILELEKDKELLSGMSVRLTDPGNREISPEDMAAALAELSRAEEFLKGAKSRINIAHVKIGKMQ